MGFDPRCQPELPLYPPEEQPVQTVDIPFNDLSEFSKKCESEGRRILSMTVKQGYYECLVARLKNFNPPDAGRV